MTKTTNYQLNQWGENDYVKRADFNADNQKIDAAIKGAIPSGCILLWSGSAASSPTGFVLCNGSNSTPDLRGRFIVGAGNSDYAVGAKGGTASEELIGLCDGSTYPKRYAHADAVHDNRPPYYALCYIMKV